MYIVLRKGKIEYHMLKYYIVYAQSLKEPEIANVHILLNIEILSTLFYLHIYMFLLRCIAANFVGIKIRLASII